MSREEIYRQLLERATVALPLMSILRDDILAALEEPTVLDRDEQTLEKLKVELREVREEWQRWIQKVCDRDEEIARLKAALETSAKPEPKLVHHVGKDGVVLVSIGGSLACVQRDNVGYYTRLEDV